MEKQRTEFFDKELWYRISIHPRTLAILLILLTLGVCGSLAYNYRDVIYEFVNRDRAQNAIERARAKLENAETLEIPEVKLEQYKKQLTDAERLFNEKEYSSALYNANECSRGLLILIKKVVDPQFALDQAIITYVEGKVEILIPGSNKWLLAKVEMQIPTGTKVRTYPDTKAEIIFKKNKISLREKSFFTLQELRDERGKKPSRMGIKVDESAHLEAQVRAEKEGDIFSIVQEEAEVFVRNDADLEYKGDTTGIDISNYKSDEPIKIKQKDQQIDIKENEAVGFIHGETIPDPEQLLFPPELLAPENVSLVPYSSDRPPGIRLRWTKATNARSYLVEVANDTHFQKLFDQQKVNSLGFFLKELTEGTYFWRVASLSESKRRSSFTEFWSFRVLAQDPTNMQYPETRAPNLVIEEVRQQGYLVIIKGKTDPGATLLVNDEKKDVEPDGSFNAFCSWAETLTVEVFDVYGLHVSEKITAPSLQ
jgi:hypothetical protein